MPSAFQLCGRIVTHTMRPRFAMLFRSCVDGRWAGEMIPGSCEGEESPSPRLLARLAREAGEFFAANVRGDWLQEAVIARAAELHLTAYAIAALTGDAVSEDHIRAYLLRKKSMGSHKLQHVLRALRLQLNPVPTV